MNEFESALATALRDEAREIAMTIDMNDGYEVVEQRMDAVDRHRRTWRWTGAIAAVAVAVLVAVAAGRALGAPDEVEPAGGPGFATTSFQPGFTVNLPAGAAEVMTEPPVESSDTLAWDRCEGTQVCSSLEAYAIRLVERTSTQAATYSGYLAHLSALRSDGAVTVTDSRETSIGGRSATLLTLTTDRPVPDGAGCVSVLRCQDLPGRSLARYAVVDTGGAPLVIGMRTLLADPQAQQWVDQLDGMLATLQLSPRQPAMTTQDFTGTYDTTVTAAAAARALSDAGLARHVAGIFDDVSPGASSMRLRLYVDATRMRLYLVDAQGREEKIDEHVYELADGRVTGLVDRDLGRVETVVLDSAIGPDGLRFSWVEGAGPASDPDIPNEAYERALYTVTAWVRSP